MSVSRSARCGISEGEVDEEHGGEAEASHEDEASPSEDGTQAGEGVDDRPLFKKLNSLKAHMTNGTIAELLANGRKPS